MNRPRLGRITVACLAAGAGSTLGVLQGAEAQLAPAVPSAPRASQSVAAPKIGQLSNKAPVTFTADNVTYDRTTGVVIATGHVEAWQGGQQLTADRVTFDRTTGVMAASGHVQLVELGGQTVYTQYAELTSNMRAGIMTALQIRLAANGRLVANGARRSPGPIDVLSRGLYSTCNLCAKHPESPVLWDLRAHTIVRDLPHKRIEYYNAWLDVLGVPVLYLPYFASADPSVKRQSGMLVPSIGSSDHLGIFGQAPYYYVIGPSSDATFVPLVSSRADAQLETIYRRAFNAGTLHADLGIAEDNSQAEGFLFTNGRFNLNDTWRYGFDVNVASSQDYLRDFHVGNLLGNVLNTQLYAEGFGEGGYAKVSALSYQGLNSTVTNSQLPYVLPRFQYGYFGQPIVFGGRLSFDSNDFNVVRRLGVNDQRANLNGQWERTGIGALGDVWTATVRVESAAYNAYDLNQQPDYAPIGSTVTARAEPTAAFKMSWPLLRVGANGSSLVLNPIAQLIAAPNTGAHGYAEVPDEDALTPQFDDMSLFSLNRFEGVDRQEGGVRANIGLAATWTTKAGVFDGLVGQSYRIHADDSFPAYVGINRHISDVVARATYTPNKWFDLTTRARFDNANYNLHYGEAVASAGPSWLRFNAGYLYTPTTPYYLDFQPAQGNPDLPRSELQGGVDTHFGHWRFSAYARRDLQNDKMVDAGGDAAYENVCTIVELKAYRRFTEIDNDSGDTTVLIQITLKTVGAFGFHAL